MNTSQEFFDVVIIGGGPGGSVLAACLAQAGASVLILEMASFPRYHIGESLTGMAAVVLDDFGLSAEMDRRQFPRKDGVKVIGKGADSEFWVPVFRPTWQVRRAEFDQILLDNAIRRGATYRQASCGMARPSRAPSIRSTANKTSARCAAGFSRMPVDRPRCYRAWMSPARCGARSSISRSRCFHSFAARGAIRAPWATIPSSSTARHITGHGSFRFRPTSSA